MSVDTPSATPSSGRRSLVLVGGGVALVLAFLVGITVSHGNGDRVCWQQPVNSNDSGASLCTNGSWGAWTETSRAAGANGATNINEQRVYTGTIQTIQGTVTVCNYNAFGNTNTQGTYTSQYNACQIQETRTRVTGGANGGGNGGTGSNGGTNTGEGNIINYNQTTSIGPATGSSTSFTGTYQDYLNSVLSALATSTLSAIPSLVHPGDKTHIVWNSSHVTSCQVKGTNGDTWTALASAPQGELSGPINAQTIYTLTCTTGSAAVAGAAGDASNGLGAGNSNTQTLTQQVTVNLIPTYKEN